MGMNADIKDAWVLALRSGEFEQGKQQLRTRPVRGDKPQFCCLGVLTELHRRACNPDQEWDGDDPDLEIYGSDFEFLPEEVVEWAGVSSDCPYVNFDGTEETLALFNDNGVSFGKIADLIEEQL